MYVIGTAGHVDHGKSTLVKTLTGTDPDRWEEEQRRAMTIDLGFAWLTLPSGRGVSIVDVPGHERFIKNMLAGVGGLDAALLVIAADEAVMPQTAEHLAILDLLGVSHGLVVLSKIDLVDAAWLELVTDEVQTRLHGTSLANAPIIPVSARSGAGLAALLAALDAELDRTPSRVAATGKPRLSIDRAFTISGFGTVVTGTLADGVLRVGDEIELLPGGLRARVRGLQSHNQKLETALPGTRVAVNLAGVAHQQIARGDMLVLPGAGRATQLIDVQLRLTADAPRPLVQNAPLDLFVGAAETACRATLLDRDALLPGESGWVQLRLAHPIAVARGDRYVVRQPSPGQTIGGGQVLDAHPARHRRFRPEVVAGLAALARGTPADLLRQQLANGQPQRWAEVLHATGLSDTAAQAGLNELVALGEVVMLTEDGGRKTEDGRRKKEDGGRGTEDRGQELANDDIHYPTPNTQNSPSPIVHPNNWLVTAAGRQVLTEALVRALQGYHRRYPLRRWMPREELRSRLKLAAGAFEAVLAMAAEVVVLSEQGARAAAHQAVLNQAQGREVRRLLDELAAAPYSPPAPELAPELLGWLLEGGLVVRVADDVVFLPQIYAEQVTWVQAQIRQHGSVTVAQFRDRFGTSRKYALALLEHLDERKLTRRQGDVRVLY